MAHNAFARELEQPVIVLELGIEAVLELAEIGILSDEGGMATEVCFEVLERERESARGHVGSSRQGLGCV